MKETLLGISLLLALVLYQVIARQLRLARLKHWWSAGNQACKQGDDAAAESAFRRCVGLMPLWTPARSALAVLLARQGKLAEAEQEFRMVADLQPRKPEGYVDLALFYLAKQPERTDAVIEAFRKAVGVAPELRDELARDPRFARLRQDPRFQELLP